MKVALLLIGERATRLADALLNGLPPPFAGGTIRPIEVAIEKCYDRQRTQVDAACLLERMPKPAEGWLHLGLTGVDLFMPALTFVFGLAELGGGRAVASWARLRPEEEDPGGVAILHRRMLVEAVHELGHCLGLIHCPVPDCPMHRSMWPESVDLKGVEYCPTCAAAVQAGS